MKEREVFRPTDGMPGCFHRCGSKAPWCFDVTMFGRRFQFSTRQREISKAMKRAHVLRELLAVAKQISTDDLTEEEHQMICDYARERGL